MTRKVIAAMRISSFFYSIKQGIKNIWRNKMFSVASIATMCACIFLFGLFYSIVENFQSMVKEAEEGVAISVFFNEGISQEQIDEIGNKIGKRVEVASYEFISADEAWERCKETYFGGSEEAAEGFAENPLANSASYEIYMKDVSMQDALVTYLESLDGVREVHHSAVVANTLSDFNKLIAYVSGGIILILLAVAIFLISNTVTVGISVRREEIAIMKYLGATDFFVRAPFLIEGMLIGLIGSLIPVCALKVLYEKVISFMTTEFTSLSRFMTFLPAGEIFKVLIPISLIIGLGIGFIGSYLTLIKHIRV